MTYDEKQMIFTGAATPEESAALALHYEIATAARAAVHEGRLLSAYFYRPFGR